MMINWWVKWVVNIKWKGMWVFKWIKEVDGLLDRVTRYIDEEIDELFEMWTLR